MGSSYIVYLGRIKIIRRYKGTSAQRTLFASCLLFGATDPLVELNEVRNLRGLLYRVHFKRRIFTPCLFFLKNCLFFVPCLWSWEMVNVYFQGVLSRRLHKNVYVFHSKKMFREKCLKQALLLALKVPSGSDIDECPQSINLHILITHAFLRLIRNVASERGVG